MHSRSVAVAGFLLSSVAAIAAPATFVTALPVAQDQALVRFNLQPSFGSPGYRSVQFPVNVGYGVTPSWALFATINQGYTSLAGAPASGGSGDTLLFVRNTLFKIDRPDSTFRIAPLAGLYAPTGSNHVMQGNGLASGPLQMGSGSFDPYAGITSGFNNSHMGFAADATYRYNPTTQTGYSPGSQFHADGQFEFTVHPVHLPAEGLPSLMVLSLETNFENDARSAAGGVRTPMTGGSSYKEDAVLELATLHWELGGGGQFVSSTSYPSSTAAREHAGAFVFFEYYLGMPSWRKR